MRRSIVIALWLLAATHVVVYAQSVTGRALAAVDRQPIAHAFVVLLDQQGQIHGGALSDSLGRWLIRAPATGRYRLRLERIGYDDITSDVLELTDSLRHFDFIVTERPFTLAVVRAESGGRGCATRADSEAVYRLWEEIQKALRLTHWTESSSALNFTTMTYVRETDAELATVLSETRRVRTARATSPFRTLVPARLMERGFSEPSGDELVLHGIDARVLLSPEFVEHYCFRIRSSAQPELVGLGFEPMRRRGTTDVRGALWVDRETAALRSLTYEYFNLPAALEAYGANAEVHFRKLNTGLWVIERWWIRTPRLKQRQANIWSRRPTLLLAGYREDGGVLMAAEDRTRSLFQLVGGGALEGVIVGRDRLSKSTVTVFLSGTPHTTTADSEGRFRIVGLPPGSYAVTARDSLLDELRLPSRMDTVQVAAGQTVTHDLRWPTQYEILRTVCEGEDEETNELTGLLYGDVSQPQTGRPLANARVQVWWGRYDPSAGMEQRWRTAFSGPDGRYYVCWIPPQGDVTVEVTAPGVPTRSLQLRIATPVQRQDVR